MCDTELQNFKLVYSELCTSYRAIDEFRTKLLGFLPLASGAGILLLRGNDVAELFPIGVFGLMVTLGLFSFEIYGIKKCHALIIAGKKIEARLGEGQFTHRPPAIARFINEPFAAGFIYPAVLSMWSYIALRSLDVHACLITLIVIIIFIGGFCGAFFYNKHLQSDRDIGPSST